MSDIAKDEIFQSTPSVWRETVHIVKQKKKNIFQSTPSVWRETQLNKKYHGGITISIHSLRMEGDGSIMSNDSKTGHFNPLPPYGGRRDVLKLIKVIYRISIHSLRMEGDLYPTAFPEIAADISIHSLRMEGDVPGSSQQYKKVISIHSLRMEGDHFLTCFFLFFLNFNPLPPYGGRPLMFCYCPSVRKFQSTPSVWRETLSCNSNISTTLISIHSLRMEGD